MKLKLLIFKGARIFLVLIVLLSLSSPLMALEKLELTIKTGAVDFFPGFPVVLYVSLKNLAYETHMDIVHCLEPEYGFVEYLVKAPDKKEFTPFIPWIYKEHPNPVKTLSGSKTIRAEAKIFFGANGWTFSMPGEYILKAVYMNEVESNEWVLSIFTPFGPYKEISNLFLGSAEVGYFLLFEGGDHLAEGKRRLEIVGSKYTQSIFGIYANFALGVNLMQDFADSRTKRIRKADYQGAVKYLEKAALSTYSFYQSVYTQVYLAELYEKLEQPDKAQKFKKGLTPESIVDMEEYYHLFREYKEVYKDMVKRRKRR